MNIVGRAVEQSRLRRSLDSNAPELVAIYGRRRVGKTYLVREFFGDQISFELTGSYQATLREQLQNFQLALRAAGASDMNRPSNWGEAFAQLRQFLEPAAGHRQVVFLDELPWLASRRSGFLRAFEHFWNAWASKQKWLVVVVCGSAASWMIQKLLHAKGGLHNRVTASIRVDPFTLAEAHEFLNRGGAESSIHQTLELYMALGGVPFYLREVDRGESAAQAIDRICFSRSGLLRDEFGKLFASLFEHSERHQGIVRALARKKSGMTRGELIEAAGLSTGGGTTTLLEELEESGFLLRVGSFGRDVRDSVYRLADEFSSFHLRWLDRRRAGEDWLTRRNSPAWTAWSGTTFESICIKHLAQLKTALGIAGVETTESTWFHQARGPDEQGAQIDLLIDRRDDCINVCEMKLTDDLFVIDKRYAADLRRKLSVFREVSGTRKSLFLTLVTRRGLRPNQYSRELVAKEVRLEELFRPSSF
ncbi:MAG: ATP-binding protein [Polyangiaceae bacterium]